MPGTTITISGPQRNGLYELVRNHLGSVGDLFDFLEREKDFVEAERLGVEFAEDFRLLQDLGWGEVDRRESVELTMPPHDLMEVLKRLHDEAEQVLQGKGTEREAREDDRATEERYLRGLDACEELLVRLDEVEKPPSMTATLTIDLRECDTLHGLLSRRLLIMVENPSGLAEAEGISVAELYERLADDLRLMEDIGWASETDQASVGLTMPREKLAETLKRLRRDARRAPVFGAA